MSVRKFLFLVVIASLARTRLLVGVVLGLLWLGSLAFEKRGAHSAALFGVLFVFWLALHIRRFGLACLGRRAPRPSRSSVAPPDRTRRLRVVMPTPRAVAVSPRLRRAALHERSGLRLAPGVKLVGGGQGGAQFVRGGLDAPGSLDPLLPASGLGIEGSVCGSHGLVAPGLGRPDHVDGYREIEGAPLSCGRPSDLHLSEPGRRIELLTYALRVRCSAV